jgi:hypothetical protein
MGSGSASPIGSLTLAYAAFVMGTMLQLLWLTRSPSTVASMSFVALGGSLFGFLPWRGEHRYSYQQHLDAWPLFFAGMLLLEMVIFYHKQLTARLGEGATLLHSIVFFYWMLDRYGTGSGAIVWVVVAAVPLAYALVNAWSDLPLSQPVRLGLSVWSTIVMAALAFQSVGIVLAMGSVEGHLRAHDLEGGASAFAQYFLLGTAGSYMLTNLMMLVGYLPGKQEFFNRAYFKRARELSREHVDRFSPEQVPKGEATVMVVAVCAYLAVHWLFRPFETPVAISILLTAVPWVLQARAQWRAAPRGESAPA